MPSHDALTTSVTVVVRVNAPLVPVIVTTNVPAGVVAAVVTVSVDDVAVAGLGLNEPAAPAGSPLAERATLPAKPPVLVIVTV